VPKSKLTRQENLKLSAWSNSALKTHVHRGTLPYPDFEDGRVDYRGRYDISDAFAAEMMNEAQTLGLAVAEAAEFARYTSNAWGSKNKQREIADSMAARLGGSPAAEIFIACLWFGDGEAKRHFCGTLDDFGKARPDPDFGPPSRILMVSATRVGMTLLQRARDHGIDLPHDFWGLSE
jgi:hypothetical protein